MKKEVYELHKQLDKHQALLKLEELLIKMEDKIIYKLEEDKDE